MTAAEPAPAPTTPAAPAPRTRSPLFSSLIGLAALGVLLQGVWAGLFVREGQQDDAHWVAVHALGGQVTTAVALIATVVAYVQLRARMDVVLGSLVFTVLLVAEVFIGGAVGDHPALETLHFPLAMALLGLAVWLPVRAARPPASAEPPAAGTAG